MTFEKLLPLVKVIAKKNVNSGVSFGVTGKENYF